MESRPSFTEIYLRFAHDLARRGTCKRLQVGCVITSEDFSDIFAVGYNGAAHGLPNGCRRDTPGSCGCTHAEANAAFKCGRRGRAAKLAFCTHQPCEMCAQALIQITGVQRVYYVAPYRLRDGLDILERVSIPAIQVTL